MIVFVETGSKKFINSMVSPALYGIPRVGETIKFRKRTIWRVTSVGREIDLAGSNVRNIVVTVHLEIAGP